MDGPQFYGGVMDKTLVALTVSVAVTVTVLTLAMRCCQSQDYRICIDTMKDPKTCMEYRP